MIDIKILQLINETICELKSKYLVTELTIAEYSI